MGVPKPEQPELGNEGKSNGIGKSVRIKRAEEGEVSGA